MSKYQKLRSPDSNELWYNTNNSYYYVVRNGKLYRIYLELDQRNIYKLLEGIQNIHISKTESCDTNILDGVHFWRFIHENWRAEIQEIVNSKIIELQEILNDCKLSMQEI